MKSKPIFKLTSNLLFILLITVLCTFNTSVAASQTESPKIQNPIIKETPVKSEITYEKTGKSLLVSAKPVFEALGATVNFDKRGKVLILRKGTLTIKLEIGNSTAYVNGAPRQLDTPPRLKGSEILLDGSFISAVMGVAVDLDATNGKINIANQVDGDELKGNAEVKYGNPELLQADFSKPIMTKEYDTAYIYNKKLTAKKLDKKIIANVAAPSKLDFSQYVTFTGNQDGWGGCIGRSMIHCINIVMEKEHPYTPDLSYRYLQYYFEKARDEYLAIHPNTPSNQWPPFTANNLLQRGICSEVDLPSDYDPAIRKEKKDSAGNIVKDEDGNTVYYHDFSPLPKPTAENDTEASLYRVQIVDIQNPGTDDVKKLMKQVGPIIGHGFTTNMDHAVSIIGYDDGYQNEDGSRGAFKILNSWGDTWNSDGICWVSYNQFVSKFITLEYFINFSSDRSSHRDAYTARIKIDHKYLRNNLTVKIGVVGKEPIVVWDQYNDSWNDCFDDSKGLCIDVPLPSYAADYWPPNNTGNSWCVEVTNNSWYDSYETEEYNQIYSAIIKEITLARLIKNLDGTMKTETFKSPITDLVVNAEETNNVYITGNKRDAYCLTLSPKNIYAKANTSILLSGKLTQGIKYADTVMAPDSKPIPNTLVAIFQVKTSTNSSGQTVNWEMIDAATTGSDGTYTYTVAPSDSSIYVAGYIDEDHEMVTTSNMVKINMLSSELPQLKKEYYMPGKIIIDGVGIANEASYSPDAVPKKGKVKIFVPGDLKFIPGIRKH